MVSIQQSCFEIEMKAQHLPLDIINTLPRSIIKNILCLMPIRDAVRTSILSRKWRYNWVTIPKLVFNEEQLIEVSITKNQESEMNYLFYPIYQVLLVHHGPILEFTLSMPNIGNYFEIDQIILYLSRNNTVKKFTLHRSGDLDYQLPSSFFSLKQLTHLNLQGCYNFPMSTFIGFGSLTSLHLDYVDTTMKKLLHFISNCPPLKSVTLLAIFCDEEESSTITELFECLSVVEHLCLTQYAIEWFAEDRVPRELSPSLAHLKFFDLRELWSIKNALSFIFRLIRSSPKLEKIKIENTRNATSPELMGSIKVGDYSDVCLDHLTEFEIKNFANFITEMHFVKLILVKSPILKRVHILLSRNISSEEELKMLRTLLCLPRASPVVQIIVKRP